MKVEAGGAHHKRYDGLYIKGYLNITHFKEKVHMSNILK